MEAKTTLKQMTERLELAFSGLGYEFEIKIDACQHSISMHFSSDTDVLSSTAVDKFRSVVGTVGVEYWSDHLVLFGFPDYIS